MRCGCHLCTARCCAPLLSFTRGGFGLPRKSLMGCCAMSFPLERLADRARPFGRWLLAGAGLPFGVIARRLLSRAPGCFSFRGWFQLDPRAPGLGQSDCDCLFCGARSMLAFPHMLY